MFFKKKNYWNDFIVKYNGHLIERRLEFTSRQILWFAEDWQKALKKTLPRGSKVKINANDTLILGNVNCNGKKLSFTYDIPNNMYTPLNLVNGMYDNGVLIKEDPDPLAECLSVRDLPKRILELTR